MFVLCRLALTRESSRQPQLAAAAVESARESHACSVWDELVRKAFSEAQTCMASSTQSSGLLVDVDFTVV